jgi:hypothetical protein
MSNFTPTSLPPSSSASLNTDVTIIQLSVNIFISIINLLLIVYQSFKSNHFACLICFGCCYFEDDGPKTSDGTSNDSTTQIPTIS